MPTKHFVGDSDSFSEGSPKAVTLGSKELLLIRKGAEIFALEDLCSHENLCLSDGGEMVGEYEIQCPWHGACFDIRKGTVTEGPAIEPIETFEVTIEGGSVFVTIED